MRRSQPSQTQSVVEEPFERAQRVPGLFSLRNSLLLGLVGVIEGAGHNIIPTTTTDTEDAPVSFAVEDAEELGRYIFESLEPMDILWSRRWLNTQPEGRMYYRAVSRMFRELGIEVNMLVVAIIARALQELDIREYFDLEVTEDILRMFRELGIEDPEFIKARIRELLDTEKEDFDARHSRTMYRTILRMFRPLNIDHLDSGTTLPPDLAMRIDTYFVDYDYVNRQIEVLKASKGEFHPDTVDLSLIGRLFDWKKRQLENQYESPERAVALELLDLVENNSSFLCFFSEFRDLPDDNRPDVLCKTHFYYTIRSYHGLSPGAAMELQRLEALLESL